MSELHQGLGNSIRAGTPAVLRDGSLERIKPVNAPGRNEGHMLVQNQFVPARMPAARV